MSSGPTKHDYQVVSIWIIMFRLKVFVRPLVVVSFTQQLSPRPSADGEGPPSGNVMNLNCLGIQKQS